jgi:cellulose synthase/poly-beta-1,6-N-acetylglucosamine synthase-like glycosyltransferase
MHPAASTSASCIASIAGATRRERSRPDWRKATGEYIAIFDADFIPPRDFLQRTLPYFASDAKIGMVQARWGHINQDYSLLTKIQSILLDAHFVLEHGGRNRGGCFFNFNGTAGVWRREAISSAGGWQHDTLTEDLDLSYRAQLAGWRFVFLPDVVSPAEVPVEMNSFKSQQHRWAKGSIQTCMKLLPLILRSKQPFTVKAEAFFHLSANFNYLLMSLLSILMFPAMWVRYNMGWTEMLLIDVPVFCAATLSIGVFYVKAQRELYPDWRQRMKYLPFLMSIGIGLVRQQHACRARSPLRESRASSRGRRSTASSATAMNGSARSTTRRSACSR